MPGAVAWSPNGAIAYAAYERRDVLRDGWLSPEAEAAVLALARAVKPATVDANGKKHEVHAKLAHITVANWNDQLDPATGRAAAVAKFTEALGALAPKRPQLVDNTGT